jgi:DNA gyrase subunit B
LGCGICSKRCPVGAIQTNEGSNNVSIRDIRFQVTGECNFNCPWCFANAGKSLLSELSYSEVIKMVDELISCGLKTMTLTGGEPLLRKDFSVKLLRYLRKKKVYAKLFTNGSLLDDKTIDDISGFADEVQISDYGYLSRKRLRSLFERLKRQRVGTALRVTLTAKNYHRIKEFVEFAQGCQVDVLRFRPFIAKGRGSVHLDYLMDDSAYAESMGYLARARRSKSFPIQLLTPSFAFLFDNAIDTHRVPKRGFVGYSICKCIDDMGAIMPDGEVRACGYFPQALGNIRKQCFEDIWSDRNPVKKGLKVAYLGKECTDCFYLTVCGGGCRANAYITMGNLFAPDPNCPLEGIGRNPVAPLSKVKEHFSLRVAKYDSSAQWVKDERLLGLIRELGCVSPEDYVLDVACGTGIISSLFFRKAKAVVGVDVTEQMYKRSSSRLDYLVNADAQELPFADNRFDLVICRQGLQFMQDPRKAVSQMYRVCKPKGKIILIHLTAFGKEDKDYAFKIQLARQPVRKNCFLEEDLINLLKWAGCVNIKPVSYFSYESINEWINNGALDLERQRRIRKLYQGAPSSYRKLHEIRFDGDDIIDKMKIAIIYGFKGELSKHGDPK